MTTLLRFLAAESAAICDAALTLCWMLLAWAAAITVAALIV